MRQEWKAIRHWRVVVGLATAATLAPAVAMAADDNGSITVSSYGGRFTDALRTAIYKPFEEATGIKVVEITGINLAKVKSMVMTKNVEVDVAELIQSETLLAGQAGLLEPMDYSKIDKSVTDQLYPEALGKYGLGFVYYSQVIAYNTKKYTAANHPKSWAEVWNVQKFPGKRMFPAGDYAAEPIEPALLADGVPADKLYPLDLPRAYRNLEKIKPDVVKWVSSSSAVPQALVDGEIDIGLANAARIIELRNQGAPIDFDWNQGILAFDYLAVPKGAKNHDKAMKFMLFATSAKVMAAFTKLLPNGPSNRAAFDLLTAEERKDVASAPENRAKQIPQDAEWWAANDGGASNFEKNARMWNTFITKQ